MAEPDEIAWRVRADAEIADGRDTGIATLCNDCLGVIHRSDRNGWSHRGWVPRYCECGTTITMADDYAGHGFTVEGVARGYRSAGRIPD